MRLPEMLARVLEANKSGNVAHAFDLAERAAAVFPENDRLAYLSVLLLARCGSTRAAKGRCALVRLRERTASAGEALRVDILALEGRLAKDLARYADESRRSELYHCAHRLYASLADDTGDPYPAINAATTAFLAGDTHTGRAYAERALAKSLSGEQNYWNNAIASEALLLLGRTQDAETILAQAAGRGLSDRSALNSTLRQISEVVERLNVDFAPLDVACIVWAP